VGPQETEATHVFEENCNYHTIPYNKQNAVAGEAHMLPEPSAAVASRIKRGRVLQSSKRSPLVQRGLDRQDGETCELPLHLCRLLIEQPWIWPM
jgi:hypothetical protein